jgi:hypothetical protein
VGRARCFGECLVLVIGRYPILPISDGGPLRESS